MEKRLIGFIVFIISFINSHHCYAKAKFESCITNDDVPRCLIEKAHQYSHTKLENDYRHILLLGDVTAIKPNNNKLLKNIQSNILFSNNFVQALGASRADNELEPKLTKANQSMLIAALALAAAAQNEENPYNDPIVKKYLAEKNNNSAISYMALELWSEYDTYANWRSPETLPKGLIPILKQAENPDKTTASMLTDLLWSWPRIDDNNLKYLLQEKIKSLGSQASSDTKANFASKLARTFNDGDGAEELMNAGGKLAKNYDIDGIYREIAIAKLKHQYDEKSARLLTDYALSEKELSNASYSIIIFGDIPEILSKANAFSELKQMANTYLSTAEDKSFYPEQRGNLYALASKCFLLAKEKEAAINAASEGVTVVKDAVTARAHGIIKKIPTPENLARAAEGWGTDAVVALYRAGAIQQAISTGYLTGRDHYKYALEAGEKQSPEWLINDYWQEGANYRTMGHNLLGFSSQQRQSIFAAALPWLEKNNWAWKDMEIQFDLAQLAASVGNSESMYLFLKRYAKQIDNEKEEQDFYAEELAEQWKRDERILNYVKSHPGLLNNNEPQ